MQIKSSISDNRRYIISGSDDGRVFIWDLFSKRAPSVLDDFRSSHELLKDESFESYDTNKFYQTPSIPTICALFAPFTSVNHFMADHPRLKLAPDLESIKANLPLHCDDLCTRILLSADADGRISVVLRGV